MVATQSHPKLQVSAIAWQAAKVALMLIAIFLTSLVVAEIQLRWGVSIPWEFSAE
jgi:hypothetical protein